MIRWTERAQNDLVDITGWIARQDSQAADCIAETILTRIDRLEQFPLLGPKGRVSDARELVIGRLPYVVIYTLVNRAPIILRILHGVMQWPIEED